MKYTAYTVLISISFVLVGLVLCRRDRDRDLDRLRVRCWLASFFLAAVLAAAVWGPVQDALRGLQRLEVLPGAKQGRVVNQRVQQVPARANPLTAGRLVRRIFLNS